MATEQDSPDGQQTTTTSDPNTSTPPADTGGQQRYQEPRQEPVYNVDDLKEAARQRDRFKQQAREEKGRASTLEQELAQAREKAEKADKLEKELEDIRRRDRRRAISDEIMKAARPDRRDDLEMMIPGFAEAGDVNFDAEDPAAEAESAIQKLSKRRPDLFADDQEGGTRGPATSPAGEAQVWTDLTPEQQREAMADPEAFRRFLESSGAGSRSSPRASRIRRALQQE